MHLATHVRVSRGARSCFPGAVHSRFVVLVASFEMYWPLVNPDGGVCVLHSTMNNHRNFRFVADLKLKQATSAFCDYEVISLVEPHKWQQNSCTLIRKVSAYNAEEHLVRGRA